MGDLNIMTLEKVGDATRGALCREDDDAVEAERSNVREVISAWNARAIQAWVNDSEVVWRDEDTWFLVDGGRGEELETALAASATAGGVVRIGESRRSSRRSATWVTHPRRDIRIPLAYGSPTESAMRCRGSSERAEEGKGEG